ncbi:MerR family transcriptional regulator [Levilactobacillus bambusae]|uniref:MerR family transcriptional regulator n=1 Tax=Levilactobacillus bambusae TaxID=2024736 RepID=A0A2V1MZP6_9LACO|nr:MerR family transcriptional regulator [Levilactobacillus bambusae]PWG00292.1 MerR family transcriptional regulator [Levilactobacillus bambusae]
MTYTIGQVAERFGLSEYTIRFYDKQGLLPFVKRNAAGRREFTDDDLKTINIIVCLKECGVKISEIHHFVDMLMAGDDTLEDRLAFFKQQQENALEQLERQKKNLSKLDFKVRYYTAAVYEGTEAGIDGDCDVPNCPITVNGKVFDQDQVG